MSKKIQPKRNSKKIFTVILILAVVAVILGVQWYLQSSRSLSQGVSSRAKGTPGAAIHIVEYIDFECPACATGAKKLKEYVAMYPEKIYLEMRYYPLLNIHPHALHAARYAQCAAQQGKFWPLHDLLIERQGQWQSLINADLEVCLQDEKTVKLILEERDKGSSLGVQSTPTYFINEKMVVGVKSLTDMLQPLLENGQNK